MIDPKDDVAIMGDFNTFITQSVGQVVPPEWGDVAKQVIGQNPPPIGSSSIPDDVLSAILFSVYSYFKSRPVTCWALHRAASAPHGLVAMVVHYKVHSILPASFNSDAAVKSVVQIIEATLTREGL